MQIFKEYDIRGLYPQQLDVHFAFQLGRAFTSYLTETTHTNNPLVSVGYDARLSSRPITQKLIEGLQASGAIVYELGLITTPMSYYSTQIIENLTGAIMVTGSHNPPSYNGFKLTQGHQALFGEKIQKLKHIILNEKYHNPQIKPKENLQKFNISEAYVKRYTQEFKNLPHIPVVIDCGNGSAGPILLQMLEAIGFECDILYEEPDGNFPHHHPDPSIQENIKALSQRVVQTKSYMGIGYDGDADRIGVVDEKGQMILGDDLMMIFSREILKVHPGALIVGDVKCSDRFYQDVQQNGGKPLMWKTGHSLIKEKMRQEKALFGGEMSGHIYFNDRNYGFDDAIYASLRLIEIVSRYKKPLSYFLKDMPEVFTTPEIRIDILPEKRDKMISFIKNKYSPMQINQIDGVRVSHEDGWMLVRASNTQPQLVIRYEAKSQKAFEKMKLNIKEMIRQNDN